MFDPKAEYYCSKKSLVLPVFENKVANSYRKYCRALESETVHIVIANLKISWCSTGHIFTCRSLNYTYDTHGILDQDKSVCM